MTQTATAQPAKEVQRPAVTSASGTRVGKRHYGTHVFLLVLSFIWLVPLLWTIYTSLRPVAETNKYGYWSLPRSLSFHNYSAAWTRGNFLAAFKNSLIITAPTVVLVLFLASLMAFAVSRFTWKFNVTLLIVFTAGNMLPPQVLAAPLFEMFKHTPLPLSVSDSGNLLNTYFSVILVNTAFQLGFCTFVLSNYMKALPGELTEAAMVDGASVWRQYRQIIMPLCRPALAALGTLEVIWIYNDFFWALLFIQTGDRLPVTTAINSMKGQFVNDYALIAAAAVMTLIPTLLVYLGLQRQFIAGLTLGGSKG